MYEYITQTQYQGVLPILMVPCSTMMKLTAMEWLAHLTIWRKNSPVQFSSKEKHGSTIKMMSSCVLGAI